ncbi:MAG: hypothetical protein JO057_31130, partial [Chloroflexi bacterium]|nr:hypothetical protein [Chloroflexota bacterium]
MPRFRFMLGIGQLRRLRRLAPLPVASLGLAVALLVLSVALPVATPPVSGQAAGSPYASAVVSDAPLAYWRLGDA